MKTISESRAPAFSLSYFVFVSVALFMAVLVVFPTWKIVEQSFLDKSGNFTFAHYVRLFSDSDLFTPLLNTLKIASGVAIACTLFAAPLAWIAGKTDIPCKTAIRLLIIGSYVTPPFLGAIAWQILAAPNSGILNVFIRSMFGLSDHAAVFNIYSLGGIIFVISIYTFPYVFTLILNALERMPGDLEDASNIAGGSWFRTATRITIPLAMPAILAGTIIAFMHAMVLFGTPAILGIPAEVYTVTTKIFALLQFPPQQEIAAAISLPMLMMTILLLQSREWLLGRRSYAVIGGKNSASRPVRLGRWRWAAIGSLLALFFVLIVLPYVAIFRAAFTRTLGQPFSGNNLTLHNFQSIFENNSAQAAIYNTLFVAFVVATVGTCMVAIIAYVVSRRLIPAYRVLNFLATAPIAIPGIILGVGLFIAYTRPPIVLYGTLAILILAFLTMELAGGYQQQLSAMNNIHPELEEAGQILGASPLRSFVDITVPLLRTSLVATWCFTFIGCIRELSAAAILVTTNTKLISTLIFDLNEDGYIGGIAVLGIFMMVTIILIMSIAFKIGGVRPTRH